MRPLLLVGLALALGCSSVSARLVAWKKGEYREAARLDEKTVRVAGHDVVYLDRGAGEPMVLLHGFGADKDNWTFLAKEIPDRYRVIAPDLPGFGLSTRDPAASYDVRAQVERVVAFLDALGLPSAHFAGNSMGGHIVARLAIEHPARVQSLTLFDPAGAKSPNPSEVARAFAEGRNPLVVSSVEDYDRLLSMMFVKPPEIPGFIKSYFAERAYETREFNAKIFADIGAKADRLDADLPRITAPTLVVWGDTDRIIDVSTADVFAAGIPGAKKVILTACGHAPMIERPAEVATLYLDFLQAPRPQ